MDNRKVVIVGAGVNGLACGLALLRDGWKNVQIWAKDFTPDTTSDVAAGLWEPAPTIGLTSTADIIPKISQLSYEKLTALLNDKDTGVIKYPGIYLSRKLITHDELPDWAKKKIYMVSEWLKRKNFLQILRLVYVLTL